MIVTYWYTSGIGVKIFKNTTQAYFDEYGSYPLVDTQLPSFLNRNGYVCLPEQGHSENGIWRRGISMTEEDAIVFLIRWAYD